MTLSETRLFFPSNLSPVVANVSISFRFHIMTEQHTKTREDHPIFTRDVPESAQSIFPQIYLMWQN